MPKFIIVAFILFYLYDEPSWQHALYAILFAILIVVAYQLLNITLRGKYYLYRIKKGYDVPLEKVYRIANRYLKLVNIILHMHITVEHYERFDPNNNYLITPNHQSNVDATVMIDVFTSPISFVAKIAIRKIIIVRDWMKMIHCLYLDKDNMRGQIKIMKEVEEQLNRHESVIIFPEGSRSFGPETQEFKSGTFKMATKTKVDILPVTINYTYKLKYRYPFRRTDVHVYIHEPLTYEDYKDLSTQQIADKVKKIVESKIDYEGGK